jgi:hypothetical protein
MQKYRADKSEKQSDGAVAWFTEWMGGPTLAKIDNCRLVNMTGDMRRTVYITGEADTRSPAVCKLAGARVRGYVTSDDEGNIVFRHCYY